MRREKKNIYAEDAVSNKRHGLKRIPWTDNVVSEYRYVDNAAKFK
jgi:hypothetical protein